MKKNLIHLMVSSALILAPVTINIAKAETEFSSAGPQLTSKQEKDRRQEIAFGSGAVVGAIVAGPIGAFVTGVASTFFAKHYNANEDIEIMSAHIEQQNQQQNTLAANYRRQLKQAELDYQQELLALSQKQQNTSQLQAENLLMSLQFSTGSSDIAPHYHSQVVALARILQVNPELSIDLSGYTDLQGDETRNHNLSLARVNSVKNALVKQGVAADKINIFAFGESAPIVANAQQEASFYDRRVVVKIHSDLNQMAKN